MKKDGTLWAWGANQEGQLGLGDTSNRDSPTEVGSASDWAAVSCGAAHTLAVKKDGTLWAWGANQDGQLGLGDNDNRLTHRGRQRFVVRLVDSCVAAGWRADAA